MPPDLVPTADVCRMLGVTRAAISLWVAAGKLTPAMRLPGPSGAMLFERADVEALHADRQEVS